MKLNPRQEKFCVEWLRKVEIFTEFEKMLFFPMVAAEFENFDVKFC